MTEKTSCITFQWQHSVWESDENFAFLWFYSFNKINLLRIKPCGKPWGYRWKSEVPARRKLQDCDPTLYPSLPPSRLDYCNSLLLGLFSDLASTVYFPYSSQRILLKHKSTSCFFSSLKSLRASHPLSIKSKVLQSPAWCGPRLPLLSHFIPVSPSLLPSHPGLLAVPETGQVHSHLKALRLLLLLPETFFPFIFMICFLHFIQISSQNLSLRGGLPWPI